MAQVITYPQHHPFEGSFHRHLARAPDVQPSVMSHPNRDMPYGPDGYYGPPAPPRYPLNTRSSSVSSTSSSASYAASYSTIPTHHASVSRTISPSVGLSDPGTAVVMYPRSHYPGFAHDYSRAAPIQSTSFPTPLPTPLPTLPASLPASIPPSLPSQYLPAHYASSPPAYPPTLAQRQLSRPSPHGSYQVDASLQQPSTMWDQTGASMYPSFSTPAYHSPQELSSYQTPPPSYPPPNHPPSYTPSMNGNRKPPQESWFVKLLQRLPEELIGIIREMIGWEDCWRITTTCSWFLANFHPDKLPKEMQLIGLLDAERSYGRHGAEDSDVPASRKSDSKGPPWLACYHCFRRKKFECFELFKWGNSSPKDADDADGLKTTRYTTPSQKQEHPYTPTSTSSGRTPPPANPHYDPSVTRSSLTAAAASRGRRTSPDVIESCSSMSPRIKETWGVRRFCVECGLREKYYGPGDLIDVQRPCSPKKAHWVCRCLELHQRPRDTKCSRCGDIVPLSCPKQM